MQDNRQKRPYKKIRREDMDIPGCATGVKVVNGNIELALKAFKRKLKDSGKIEELKARKEYIKPSAVKRKKMQQAVRAEYRRRMFEN
jgi:small subunit ribosomal protein S21|tara:strand:- start:647 stop:907 length:261 start_codon:yes stop_codon:yes gene_type:complete